MRVHIKLFAILRERAGQSEFTLELPASSKARDAMTAIAGTYPSIAGFLPRVAVAINQTYAREDAVLNDGDELALIPPVSGGADDDWIELCEKPIDIEPVVAFVSAPNAGGIDIFLGTTRDETSPDGKQLLALDYEAYPEMAVNRLRQLATEARARWPIVRLAILHRVSRVEVAIPSVVIAVSTPHRAESFEACRWLIDELKRDVPIWKREVWNDGTGTWVHPAQKEQRLENEALGE